jgi:hypothetical protein
MADQANVKANAMCGRVVAVSIQPASTASTPMLRRLVVALWMYEPALVLCIHAMVPLDEPEVASVGRGAFEGCCNLVSVAIPSSVTRIDDLAFNACSSLAQVVAPASIRSIGNSAFGCCTSLTSAVIPDSTERISVRAFWHCTSLTSARIPPTVTTIGSCAFAHCRKLTSIVIPDSVAVIGNRAFSRCRALIAVELSASVDTGVFDGCSAHLVITRRERIFRKGEETCGALIQDVRADQISRQGDAQSPHAAVPALAFL